MMKIDPIQVVVDIGSSKIRVMIASRERHQPMEIIACCVSIDASNKSGLIADVRATAEALRSAMDEAEKQSGVQIQNVDVSIGGAWVSGINTDAMREVHTRHISQAMIDDLVYAAKARVQDDKHEFLHVLDQQFIVDEHAGIDDPLRMTAERLEVRLHVLRVQKNVADNLRNTIEMAGVGVNSFIFSGLASAYGATSEAQRELGCCVLDIGADTSNYMVYKNGQAIYSGGLNIGGENVSSDIAMVLKTPREVAERLKREQGALLASMMPSPTVEVPSVGFREPRQVGAHEFSEIMASRYEDIFTELQRALFRSGMRRMNEGNIVITGGGAKVRGLAEYAANYFSLPVNVVFPDNVPGLPDNLQENPSMMTCLGMLKILYEPISDYVWVKPPKTGIIGTIKNFLSRY